MKTIQAANCRIALSVGTTVAAICLAANAARAGVLYAWGGNDYGQLGNGTSDPNELPAGNYSTPAPVIGLSYGINIDSAGAYDSFAVQNGAAYAWGADGSGELGTGTGTITTPVAVTGLSSGVTAISAGDYHTLAIQNGAVLAWGDNSEGETSSGTTIFGTPLTRVTNLSSGVTSVAAGLYYSLAIQNGGVKAWGVNWHGQLGDGTTSSSPTYTPVPVVNLSSGVTAISAGGSIGSPTHDGTWYSHNLAIQNGAVFAWGGNQYGQLGNGTTTNSLVPVPVAGLTSGVTAIAAGYGYSLALRNGGVYAWGGNFNDQLGNGTASNELTPELIDPTDLHNITAIAAAFDSSFALSADGSLWVWGDNFDGQLGLGSAAEAEYLTPQLLLPPNGYLFTSISGQGDGDFVLATLTPIPEPGSVLLLGIGCLALLARRRRPARGMPWGK